jgi:hypothetical protein
MTIGIIIIGFTTFVYAVSVLTNLFVSGETLTQADERVVGTSRDHRRVRKGRHRRRSGTERDGPPVRRDRLPRSVVLLKRDQELGHDILPALVELPDDVGADLARGREDPEESAGPTHSRP